MGPCRAIKEEDILSRVRGLLRKLKKDRTGQGLVEFTLVFVLLLVIAWIPADFGLAFYTGQLAQNAAREGARIGAATRPFNANDVRTETCKRLPSALLADPAPNCLPYSRARVDVVSPPGGPSCNQQLKVTVTGNYNFFFFQLLRLVGVPAVPDSVQIKRETEMRWEHQC
jgi:Flp pilus assembly protein TadG